MTTLNYRTVDEIVRANQRAGFHFFDRDAMRFFGSRVHDEVYGGRFFVTSELDFYGERRFYTVREATEDGSVEVVGEFQQYASRSGAHAAARRYAAQEVDG